MPVQRICLSCRKTFNTCSSCYRGQRYCSSSCRKSRSIINQRSRSHRYRKSPEAKEKARLRQQRFGNSAKKKRVKTKKKKYKLGNARSFHASTKRVKAQEETSAKAHQICKFCGVHVHLMMQESLKPATYFRRKAKHGGRLKRACRGKLKLNIRQLYYRDHWHVGTIASNFGMHPDTVKKALKLDKR